MLELHGDYSVDELKCHCDVHLVFLEGSILGQLHKKPMIPRLMGGPSRTTGPSVVVIDDVNSDNVQTGQKYQGTLEQTVSKPNKALDHTYASPTPQVCKDASTDIVESDKSQEQQQHHDNPTYVELSDMPTEPYGCESDSQDDVITTGGKFIISRSDKVEISLEYQ